MLEILSYVAAVIGGVAGLWFLYDRISAGQNVTRKVFNRARSEEYKERGRERVQNWGIAISRGEWNWDLLGQSLEYYFDAIRYDPSHQHPWTNLAYVYHLIGANDEAEKCLAKSIQRATHGPDYPGRNYKQVAEAISNNKTLSGSGLSRPPIPESFCKKYRDFLRSVPQY